MGPSYVLQLLWGPTLVYKMVPILLNSNVTLLHKMVPILLHNSVTLFWEEILHVPMRSHHLHFPQCYALTGFFPAFVY